MKEEMKMRREETKNLIRYTYENFRFNIKQVMYFELIYKLITMLVFIPVNTYLINRFIGGFGLSSISNTQLLEFGLTPKGFSVISMVVLVSFIAIFIEMSVLIYIASKSHKKTECKFAEPIINSIRILPDTIGPSILLIVLVAGVIGPFTGIGLYSSLIRNLSIPSFIKIELFKTMGGTILYYSFHVIVFVLLFRWILSIPAAIIEDNKIKVGIKNGTKIYQKNRLKIIEYIIAFLGVMLIIGALSFGIYIGIGTILIKLMGTNSIMSGVISIVLTSGFYIVYILVSLVTVPLFISFLVEIYYNYRDYEVEERKFRDIRESRLYRVVEFVDNRKKKFKILCFILFAIMVTAISFEPLFYSTLGYGTMITAHRGSSVRAPENSMSAIKLAIDEKADYIEIDVQTTKDDKVVLFHDKTLKRTANMNTAIKDMTYDELKNIDNGSYFSPEFKGEKIPTLEEVLEYCKGKIRLNIELKPQKENDSLSKEVVELVKKYGAKDEVVISSLNYDALQEIKLYDPTMRIGYIVSIGLGDLSKINVDFLSVEKSVLNTNLLYSMHLLGKEVHVWTINDEKTMKEMILNGVDNIITDDVLMANKVKRDLEENNIKDYLTIFYETTNSIIKHVKI